MSGCSLRANSSSTSLRVAHLKATANHAPRLEEQRCTVSSATDAWAVACHCAHVRGSQDGRRSADHLIDLMLEAVDGAEKWRKIPSCTCRHRRCSRLPHPRLPVTKCAPKQARHVVGAGRLAARHGTKNRAGTRCHRRRVCRAPVASAAAAILGRAVGDLPAARGGVARCRLRAAASGCALAPSRWARAGCPRSAGPVFMTITGNPLGPGLKWLYGSVHGSGVSPNTSVSTSAMPSMFARLGR